MHLDLVDSLRCPGPHEETWMVVTVERQAGRSIVEGRLGCPMCRREFTIRTGVADFRPGNVHGNQSAGGPPVAHAEAVAIPPAAADLAPRHAPRPGDSDAAHEDETVLRIRALLSLDGPGGIVLLGGRHARYWHALEREGAVTALLVNPVPEWARRGAPSAILTTDGVPLASASVRGAWLDDSTSGPALLESAARTLVPGGRLVAPVSAAVPRVLRELARDDAEWVAESGGRVSTPMPLRRQPRGDPRAGA